MHVPLACLFARSASSGAPQRPFSFFLGWSLSCIMTQLACVICLASAVAPPGLGSWIPSCDMAGRKGRRLFLDVLLFGSSGVDEDWLRWFGPPPGLVQSVPDPIDKDISGDGAHSCGEGEFGNLPVSDVVSTRPTSEQIGIAQPATTTEPVATAQPRAIVEPAEVSLPRLCLLLEHWCDALTLGSTAFGKYARRFSQREVTVKGGRWRDVLPLPPCCVDDLVWKERLDGS